MNREENVKHCTLCHRSPKRGKIKIQSCLKFSDGERRGPQAAPAWSEKENVFDHRPFGRHTHTPRAEGKTIYGCGKQEHISIS